MLNPRIGARYAKSLLDIANEQNQLETVFADMQFLNSAISGNREGGGLVPLRFQQRRAGRFDARARPKVVKGRSTGSGVNRLSTPA